MYLEFYNFTRMPFGEDSDPDVVFPGAQYRYSLATMVHGVVQGMGMLVLTGEQGCGKSTLFKSLHSTLEQEGQTVLVIDDPKTGISDVVASIASLLDRAREGMGLNDLVDRIRGRLTELSREGRKLVVLVDNAELLSDEVLVGLGALSGIGTPQNKLLQVVLIGGEQLKTRMNFGSLSGMKNRVRLHLELECLSEAEAFAYIKHRLSAAGGNAGLFTDSCISLLVEGSRGNPGVIDRLCDQTLYAAYRAGATVIDLDIARGVISPVQPKPRSNVITSQDEPPVAKPVEVQQPSVEVETHPVVEPAADTVSQEQFIKPEIVHSHASREPQAYRRRSGAGGRFGVTVAVVMGGIFLGVLGYLVADFSKSGFSGSVALQADKRDEPLPQLNNVAEESGGAQERYSEQESVPVIYRLLSGGDSGEQGNLREAESNPVESESGNDSMIPVLAATEGVKPTVRPLELEQDSERVFEAVPEVEASFVRASGAVPFPFSSQREGEWRKMPDKLTLSQLARKQFGSWNDSVKDILRHSNPQLKSFDAIVAGTKIWIPVISPKTLIVNSQGAGYYFYFRSTTGPVTARRNKAYLQKKGVGAFVQSIESPQGTVHRIYAGPFDTPEEAEGAMKNVKFTFAPSVLN